MYHSPLMPSLDSIVFDLYGTLLRVGGHSLHREIPRLLGASRSQWVALVRSALLITDFPDDETFASYVCDELAPGHSESVERECLELLRRELEAVDIYHGVPSLLAFLKRRGFKLGLLSNLSSVYRPPVSRFGLTESFDSILFSCEEGRTKPDPQIYAEICARLEATPESTLVVGDSFLNDVQGPMSAGMSAIQVFVDPSTSGADTAARVGLLSFRDDGGWDPLLEAGMTLPEEVGGGLVQSIHPVADNEQGRYNLVYRVETAGRPVYCKRFLLPESVRVEEFAFRLQGEIGLPSCAPMVLEGAEPLLLTTEVAGEKYAGAIDVDVARELGRHVVFAYVFSNADIRPRNALVDRSGPKPRMTMVDLEHCFFNVAIETTDLEDALRPEMIDELTGRDVSDRRRRTVLTARAMRRALSTFFEAGSTPSEVVDAFCAGFLEFYEDIQRDRERILGLIERRIYQNPPLIIGTHAYRRAMARVDLDDIRMRLEQDPRIGMAMLF